MSDKDIQRLIELAESQLERSFTQEEALASLVSAGILDENGNPTLPYQELAKEQA
ncbi:MAG TPA: hypothetical protein VHD83_23070 [Puia sp.]|nr:hypothetical protein [Puia sp.]